MTGMDISEAAIKKCVQTYGDIAEFRQGDHLNVPDADLIIASNVFEHLDDDIAVAKSLLQHCSELKVIVPYREDPLHPEHVTTYELDHFRELNASAEPQVFPCRGWSEYGRTLYLDIRARNVVRLARGQQLRHRMMQVVFHLKGEQSSSRSI
jgi:hypothetical protein